MRPSWLMLRVRVPGGVRSGRSRASVLTGKVPEVLSSTPPPTSRQAPVIAGRQEMVRTAIPPPAWRFRP